MVEMIGVFGAGCILIAFTMNQIGRWSNDSFLYDGVNALGALCLMVYAYLLDSLPFLILNTVWFLVAIRDVLKAWRAK